VVSWSAVDGWGVLRSDSPYGLVFAHFSAIRDQVGYRSLEPGRRVWFRWERPGQEGCDLRATEVHTRRPSTAVAAAPHPDERPDAAYRSSLEITFDDPPGESRPPSP
jgi:cold shock CspA family protein